MKYYYFVSFAHETIQKSAKYNGYGSSEIITAGRIKSKDQLDKIKEVIEQKIMSNERTINNYIDKIEIVILNYIFLRKERD